MRCCPWTEIRSDDSSELRGRHALDLHKMAIEIRHVIKANRITDSRDLIIAFSQ